MPSGFATLRDVLAFVVGVGILVYSIIFDPPPPEPLSVAVGVALAGFPTVSMLGGRNGAPPAKRGDDS